MLIKARAFTENAILPTQSTIYAAGWDLYAAEDVRVGSGQRQMVKTGISLEIPEGYAGLIWPRSGLAVKNGIDVLAGVIDSDYRGEIIVCLLNTNFKIKTGPDKWTTGQDLDIKKGDRIAQLIIQEIPDVKMEFTTAKPKETSRGSKGFGSSGQ